MHSPPRHLDLHRDCLVLDGHTDVPTRLFHQPADLSARLDSGHVDLPRLREGGVGALFFALYVPSSLSPEDGLEHARELHRLTREQLREGDLEGARSVAQVRRVVARGGVAVLLGLENGRPLQLPGVLEECLEMGVRYVTPTHVESHEWCDASTDAPRHGGLSRQGEELIWRMTGQGIVVDVAHVSDDAVRHIVDVSRAPVLATHSSARALCDHPRNLPDELVREIARRDGVVMANAYPAFLDRSTGDTLRARMATFRRLAEEVEVTGREALAPLRQRYVQAAEEHPLPEVPFERFVDHLIHLVEVAGEEHVGLGTDFDGIQDTPVGFRDARDFPRVTDALVERGLEARAVRLILGENALRVLEEAERLAL